MLNTISYRSETGRCGQRHGGQRARYMAKYLARYLVGYLVGYLPGTYLPGTCHSVHHSSVHIYLSPREVDAHVREAGGSQNPGFCMPQNLLIIGLGCRSREP